ncbi:hypothetical protein SCHPADRAFT_936375 [Schizopora paradoxa]|uniref:Uncharacterized protein n=1 Tax=Schizopora paradoxa TaxID=27342 RepID=A0A0H2S306_9AGAM|nr:hypothetical protein SCHPADRAFT_936375 [Schizopora paradoxa]
MASLFDLTQFPDRPSCFQPSITLVNLSCDTPSFSMLLFLNISDPASYFQHYCLNPPNDSCAFGFCPNSDIAGLAVRIASYVSAVCLSITVLYSPEDMTGAFYGQLLQIYSLVIATIVAIGSRQLSRLHANFVLFAVSSPLSLYIVTHAFVRSVSRKDTRLKPIFGYDTEEELGIQGGRVVPPVWMARLNRALVLILVPVWLVIFVITLMKKDWFIQESCGLRVYQGQVVDELLMVPAIFFASRSLNQQRAIVGSFSVIVIAWIAAIIRTRNLWYDRSSLDLKEPWGLWRNIRRRYPFLMFVTVILYPFSLWIAALENSAWFLNETADLSYGQLLAIFVAVPPLYSCFWLWKDLKLWISGLTWIKSLSSHARPLMRRNSSEGEDVTSSSNVANPVGVSSGSELRMNPSGPRAPDAAFLGNTGSSILTLSPPTSPKIAGDRTLASNLHLEIEDPLNTNSYQGRESSLTRMVYTRRNPDAT